MGRVSRKKASGPQLKIHVHDDAGVVDAFRWLRDRASTGLALVIDEIVEQHKPGTQRNRKKAVVRAGRTTARVSV